MITGRAQLNRQSAIDTLLLMLQKKISVERQHIIALFHVCSDSYSQV